MRIAALALTGVLTVCGSASAIAAQLPTNAQCHALARQRGAGEENFSRNHERFIRDCLAGKVSLRGAARVPPAVGELRAQSSDLCHELARQRGAGETGGRRNHERFTSECMAGRVPVTEGRAINNSTPQFRKRSSEECHAMARQRGSAEENFTRNHERFIRDCMAGRVS
jgi:hypothetical protein